MPGQQYYANHQIKYNPVIAIDTLTTSLAAPSPSFPPSPLPTG